MTHLHETQRGYEFKNIPQLSPCSKSSTELDLKKLAKRIQWPRILIEEAQPIVACNQYHEVS